MTYKERLEEWNMRNLAKQQQMGDNTMTYVYLNV